MLSPDEQRVLKIVDQIGPLEAFQTLIEENNALIQGAVLDNGETIARQRAAIYTALVHHWAKAQAEALGYDRPFAVAAIGGTGRDEMCPKSDLDFAFLFDEPLEGNEFLLELQRQVLHQREFDQQYGFQCESLPFCLDDVPDLDGKQLNAFLDLRPVYDPAGLAGVFRERMRELCDRFRHFLYVREAWKKDWEGASRRCERLDRFDIKNEGLRVFLAAIWTLAGEEFRHSHDVYRDLEDPRDLDAYYLLLRIRSFVQLRHSGKGAKRVPLGSHVEDVLDFNQFVSLGDLLGDEADEAERFAYGNEVRAQLLAARRRVGAFARAVMQRALTRGRSVRPNDPMVYGLGGLVHTQAAYCETPEDKSRAAIGLLVASQRYGVPVDPAELQSTFDNAGDWLVRTPELSQLFYEEKGSLADSFEFLAQVDGTQECLFPGYARFEASLDARVMKEQESLRGALERQKLRILEDYVRSGREQLAQAISRSSLLDRSKGVEVELEAALLDADHLAAIKLALKTKRLPSTDADVAARDDKSRPLYERYSTGMSGILLSDYYKPFEHQAHFPRKTLEITEFLVRNRRAFKEWSHYGMADGPRVREFVELCQSESRLRALYVFITADQEEWKPAGKEPVRWFNIQELYIKAMNVLRPPTKKRHLQSSGFTPDQEDLMADFGDVFTGLYGSYAIQFVEHLEYLSQESKTDPKVKIFPGGIIGVATHDYRGLAATISGALAARKISLHQAHLFSGSRYQLALDFFHVPGMEWSSQGELTEALSQAIRERGFISESDRIHLRQFSCHASLTSWRKNRFRLKVATDFDGNGLLYTLSYKVFRDLGGNIFGLNGHSVRGRTYVSVYHDLPEDRPLEETHKIVQKTFTQTES